MKSARIRQLAATVEQAKSYQVVMATVQETAAEALMISARPELEV